MVVSLPIMHTYTVEFHYLADLTCTHFDVLSWHCSYDLNVLYAVALEVSFLIF